MSKVDVSIIIVFFSGKQKLLECLKSIKNHKSNYSLEVIVVNNGAEQIEQDVNRILPKVHYIKSPRNGGYGYGNNLGAEKAKGKYVFILNPDTKLLPRTIDILTLYLNKHDSTAIVSPVLVDPQKIPYELQGTETLTPLAGAVVHSFVHKLFPNNFISRRLYLQDVPRDAVHEVSTVPGSAFMIRKDVFDEVRGFDEHIFLFFEESDLGKRVQDAGYHIAMHPDSKVIHYWANKEKGNKKMAAIAAKSRFYYFKKHYGLPHALFVEIFARFSKRKAIIAAVILLAVLLIYI
jgi:GT2 family glycosyltransferase